MSQAIYAASQLNKALGNKPYDKLVDNYMEKLNDAFIGLCTFSIYNNKVTISNDFDEVVVYGTRKK